MHNSNELNPKRDFYNYEPIHPTCKTVWGQLSNDQRKQRFEEALIREELVLLLINHKNDDEFERKAIRRLMPSESRSNILRWKNDYLDFGIDGLIKWNMPPHSQMPSEIKNTICTLRRGNPKIRVEEVIEHLLKHHNYKIGKTSIRNVLRKNNLSRPPGRMPGDETVGENRLECGGAAFIEVMDQKYGCTYAITKGIEALRDEIVENSPARPVDTSDRDEWGRFISSYNERYRKKADDEIGPGYLSIDLKRPDKDPNQFHLNRMGTSNIQRKLIALMMKPVITNERWDNLRVVQGDLFEELCGYPYMPATLDLFSRELKYLAVSQTLWEIHARKWLEHLRHFHDENAGNILFVDDTNKPLWTSLFSESTRISSVGKVMPGLEVVCFHTSSGVPLLMTTYSGRAPLVREVPHLLKQISQKIENETLGRIIVIDAEGNSIPFLKGLEQGDQQRAWVTRLKEKLVHGKRIFNRTNYRSYRNGDRIRMGVADFNDTNRKTFRMRVIEIERRSKGTVTYLGASLLLDEKEWNPSEIADLYFERWPQQEANFRAVNQATGSKKVHGYGKQLVNNISVLTDMDKLANRIGKGEAIEKQLLAELSDLKTKYHEGKKELKRNLRRQETIKRQLDGEIKARISVTPKLRTLVSEQKTLDKKIEKEQKELKRLKKAIKPQEKKLNQVQHNMEKDRKNYLKIEGNQKIFSHDIELDSFFTLLKSTFVLLIQYAIKELLGDAKMDPDTFVERIINLPARHRKTPQLEILTFEYNVRDPEVMSLLMSRCEAINAMNLKTRSGRVLQVRVDPAPPPKRPPPRSKKRNRFIRNEMN